MSRSLLRLRGPWLVVQAAQGTVVHHLQVHLVAHQLPDVVDAVLNHRRAGREASVMSSQVAFPFAQDPSGGSQLLPRESHSPSHGPQGPITSLSSSPPSHTLTPLPQVNLASLLLSKHTRPSPASGLQHWLCPLPGTLFQNILTPSTSTLLRYHLLREALPDHLVFLSPTLSCPQCLLPLDTF